MGDVDPEFQLLINEESNSLSGKKLQNQQQNNQIFNKLPLRQFINYDKNHLPLLPQPQSQHSSQSFGSGLYNFRALLFLILWYIFSGCTLFLNKYILTSLRGDPTMLGTCQMLMTLICGLLQMRFPCGMYKLVKRKAKPPGFFKHMILVGVMRFTTVLLGLISLNYVAVSFTETIKSSAPIFTVVISRLLLGEKTGFYVNVSLVPVMAGLALCSSNELSFDVRGFLAAMCTNLTECLQNVYSKMLISGERYKYTPAELQFYTSMSSMLVQIPVSILLVDTAGLDVWMFASFLLNGVFFHFQSISAYVLMDYISPVTHSVANTAKRAFLIFLSIILFGNEVTILSGLGTTVVIAGVLLYNKAREFDDEERSRRRVIEFQPRFYEKQVVEEGV